MPSGPHGGSAEELLILCWLPLRAVLNCTIAGQQELGSKFAIKTPTNSPAAAAMFAICQTNNAGRIGGKQARILFDKTVKEDCKPLVLLVLLLLLLSLLLLLVNLG